VTTSQNTVISLGKLGSWLKVKYKITKDTEEYHDQIATPVKVNVGDWMFA